MRITEQGFSLIELIVVVSLISILMAIGLPGFLDWRSRVVYKDNAETVAAALREARMLSHSHNLQHRVEFDLAGQRYRVTRGNRAQNSSDFSTVFKDWAAMNPILLLKRDADCAATANFSLGFNANGTAAAGYLDGAQSSDYLCILDATTMTGYRVGVSSATTGRTVVDRHP